MKINTQAHIQMGSPCVCVCVFIHIWRVSFLWVYMKTDMCVRMYVYALIPFCQWASFRSSYSGGFCRPASVLDLSLTCWLLYQVSQRQYYWHVELADYLCCEAPLGTLRCLAVSLTSMYWRPREPHTPPCPWQPQMPLNKFQALPWLGTIVLDQMELFPGHTVSISRLRRAPPRPLPNLTLPGDCQGSSQTQKPSDPRFAITGYISENLFFWRLNALLYTIHLLM